MSVLFQTFLCFSNTAKTKYEGASCDEIRKQIKIVLTGVLDWGGGREMRKEGKAIRLCA